MACVSCGADIAPEEQRCSRCGAAPPQDPLIGAPIGPYTVVRRIARGGHSSIYEARGPEGPAAIKVLHASKQRTRESTARLRREAVAIKRLEHPNVVKLFDWGETADGSPWLAMELLRGESLAALLARVGAISPAELLAILAPICEALEEAHHKGVVHRDVKPENVMLVDEHGRRVPKLLDFGIACLRDADTLTSSDVVSGTPMYMAPEQWEGLTHADERSDVYALGVIAYRALSGKLPYAADTALVWMKKTHLEPPIDLASAIGGRAVSAMVCAAVMKALAKDPSARPQTPMELLRTLQSAPEIRRGEGQKRGRPAWSMAAVLIAALLGSGIGFYVSRVSHASTRALRKGSPIVLVMDTPVARGVYDADAVAHGGSNADTLNDVLRDLPITIEKETLPSTWNREMYVLDLNPDVIVIHRSAFFHGLNLEFGYGYEPFADDKARDRWTLLYRTAEDKLVSFLGLVATVHPQTKFLVYSRGTGSGQGGWPDPEYRKSWVMGLEQRFSALRGRITTMAIEGGVDKGSFKNPKVAAQIRQHLRSIMTLAER
jgi:serine/threonine protein kinase